MVRPSNLRHKGRSLPTSLPITLVLAWASFFAFFLSQGHHERELTTSHFLESPNLLKALGISTLLGMIVGVGILAFYFYKVSWYWPLLLAVGGSMIGAAAFGLLSGLVSSATISKGAFIGWPLSAVCAIQMIHIM
jgi:hypothetical protein